MHEVPRQLTDSPGDSRSLDDDGGPPEDPAGSAGVGADSPRGAGADPPPIVGLADPQFGEGLQVVSSAGIPSELVSQDALRVISRLDRNGFEAYLVGGCVRDLLLGRAPKDFDVATAAHPRQIKRLFRNGRIIGRRFKLVHVVYGRHIIETATFRAKPPEEGEEDDLLIREDNVFGTAAEDARRRDFTINGLFLDPQRRRILDYVGGLEDLEAGLLRTIGEPLLRMHEDPVRILRAIKFATRLGLRIADDTWGAMCKAASELSRSAPPRVLEEILRLAKSGTALGGFRMMRACGAMAVLMPVVDNYLGERGTADPAAHERADRYWRLLEALDAEVHAGKQPSSALCVAVLFLHIIERESDPTTRSFPGPPPRDLLGVAEEVLHPVAVATRLSRRDYAQAKRMVANQARFTQQRTKRSRNTLFLLSEDFRESLALFRLRSAAWGQGWDVYEGWLEQYKQARRLSDEDLAVLRKRRRRRRRRKPHSGPAAAGSAPPDDED